MRHLALLLVATVTAFAIPSQRDQLQNQYIKARGDYATALKSGNKEAVLQAMGGLQTVGKAVISANQAPISASSPGIFTYPSDAKTVAGRKSYAQKMSDLNRRLLSANNDIAEINLPNDVAPAGLREVELLIGAISRGIEAHHTACLNIR